ncbi:MAG: His/Gly/Thr/Pro-type tRNA ligase C-terminal domain-containing protein, partial [Atopobiaceae bacterium]|nr:His/Gly/Thr/Pro-type tRNA ligase C-terminal domain-containing protein [Atopobiaceae bacterium]
IALALQAQGVDLGGSEPSCVYVACTPDVRSAVFGVVLALRNAGIRTEADYQGRSLKSQFKQADKLGARVCVVLGSDEVAAGVVTLRQMDTHEQVQVPVSDVVASVRERLG